MSTPQPEVSTRDRPPTHGSRVHKVVLLSLLGLLATWGLLTVVLNVVAEPKQTKFVFAQEKHGSQLVVVVHGLGGSDTLQSVLGLVTEAFPLADVLAVQYDSRPLSNDDPYKIADSIEGKINELFVSRHYSSVLLVGHSMGALLLRKVLLWANGEETDRPSSSKGRHEWADHVERLVSLAGINRGWSISPRPKNMPLGRYILFATGEALATITGTGNLILSIRRGAPFVADSRVQWIHLINPRTLGPERKLPQVIHLLGSEDDIVSNKDAKDIGVANDSIFVTLPATDHIEIARDLAKTDDDNALRRRQAVHDALLGNLDKLPVDEAQKLKTNGNVKRLVYVVHGIRDRGDWAVDVRNAIESKQKAASADAKDPQLVVMNDKYGYFAMLPFLLSWERQSKVRAFMDDYTENLARFPNLESNDYVGHSNGTYLLASALQHYRTIRVDRVFFAGSVMPSNYPWSDVFAQRRVTHVVNVVAAGDWVVAIFPRLFEQLATWLGRSSTSQTGVLDLGGAGFLGFNDASDPEHRVVNVQYVNGGHSSGVDTRIPIRTDAIVAYILRGDESLMKPAFEDRGRPYSFLDFISNVQWVVWLILIAVAVLIGRALFRKNKYVCSAYVVFLILFLCSV